LGNAAALNARDLESFKGIRAKPLFCPDLGPSTVERGPPQFRKYLNY
jgi:hypothetical protein